MCWSYGDFRLRECQVILAEGRDRAAGIAVLLGDNGKLGGVSLLLVAIEFWVWASARCWDSRLDSAEADDAPGEGIGVCG